MVPKPNHYPPSHTTEAKAAKLLTEKGLKMGRLNSAEVHLKIFFQYFYLQLPVKEEDTEFLGDFPFPLIPPNTSICMLWFIIQEQFSLSSFLIKNITAYRATPNTSIFGVTKIQEAGQLCAYSPFAAFCAVPIFQIHWEINNSNLEKVAFYIKRFF